MRSLLNLLALPANLIALTLIRTRAHELQWPYNLPRDVKYFPEDVAHIKRELAAQEKLQWQTPIGMKKLSEDPSEKFFLHDWSFGEVDEELAGWNRSYVPWSAVLRHANQDSAGFGLFGRSVFHRDSTCPSGTFSCDNTSDVTYCCSTGDTCVTSSSGSVGCCPPGETCGDGVSGCDTGSGYSACGDGCCVPGAECASTVCVFYGTQTVTTTLPTATVTTGVSTVSKTPVTSSSSSPLPPAVQPSVYTTTATVTISGSDSTETTTVIQPTTVLITPSPTSTAAPTCSSGFFSCPASLGGGCCRDGQACESGTQCSDTTSSTLSSSATASAPVLPTSISSTTTDTPVSGASSVVGCPTGFYMCSAVYLGGCCRVDRDCHTTFCPAPDTTNVVTGSDLTIGAGGSGAGTDATTATTLTSAPATTTTPVATSGCMENYSLCPANVGGGCCPSGYSCAASCIATASGLEGDQPKAAASDATVEGFIWSFLAFGVGTAASMIWL